MLDQDEGHAVPGGQRVQELPAGLKTARRGADSDDRESAMPAQRSRRRFGVADLIAVVPF